MNNGQSPASSYQERTAGSVRVRFEAAAVRAEWADAIASRAEPIARYVDKRLKPLIHPGERFPTVPVVLEPESPASIGGSAPDSGPPRVMVGADPLSRDVTDQLAAALVRQRLGGPEVWAPPTGTADAPAIANTLYFLAYGLARYFVSQAERDDHGNLFGTPADGALPRQRADQVCRQIVADRDGKMPLYECLMRGPTLAGSPPEYAALAESFCGYLFERDGPKAYQRLVVGCRENPNAAADLIYGKTLEQLQDEWLGFILRGQGRRPVSIKTFARQVIPYLRPYAWLVILALMLMFLSGAVSAIAPFQIRDIIDIVAKANTLASSQSVEQNMQFFSDLWLALTGQLDWATFQAAHQLQLETLERLYIKIVILALVVFVNLCAIIWLIYIVNVVGQNILRDLRVQFTDRIHHLGASFYSRTRMGDMLSRFTSDIARMADPLAEATAYSIYYLIRVLVTVWAMFAMSWQLSLVLFLVVPTYFVINRRFGPAMQAAARTRQERLAQLNAGLEEQLFGHALIKGYGLGDNLMGRFRPKILEFRKVAIWADFLRAIYSEVIGIAENIQTKLVLAAGGTLAVFGVISTGTIIGFNGLAASFITPLHRLGLIYAGISIASASLRRVEEILREPIEQMDTPPGGTFAPEGVHQAIRFDHVTFSYTGAEPTLRDINLHIPAGAKVAFVGPTGAGKSTLVNLIPRFYDVDHGAVTIDGRNIRSFALAGLRRSISIVSQDTFIFNTTLLENIRLGRLDATDDEVIEAAKGAQLHSFIEALPAGYDTLVGERGSRLSGGQKQRVSIARALLRNSPILILDEATSALDAETESEILSELEAVTRGKTVISITHRLGLAIKSEKIYVLQAGQIVEEGSHEELIQRPGLYRKLFEDQNRELMRRGAGDQLGVTLSRVRAAPSFSIVSAEQLASVAHLASTERLAAGAALTRGDGANGRLYLLRSGQVELTIQDERGLEQRMAVGAPVAAIGADRPSLLLSIPASASARTLTEVEIDVLSRDDLAELLGHAWDADLPPSAGREKENAGRPRGEVRLPAPSSG